MAAMEDDDYRTIEQAVMATERGRRFLAAFLDRQRSDEAAALIAAAERLHDLMTAPPEQPATAAMNDLRLGLYDMSEAIAKTKAEVASLKPEDGSGALDVASEELDAVVTSTEEATSEILNAAEGIQEVAWALREQGVESEHLDALDAKATEIYTCCSFQDLTGQRIGKVVKLLGYLEDRIAAMTAIWNGDAAEGTRTGSALTHDPLLNGPAMPGQGVDQSDVDALLNQAAPAEAAGNDTGGDSVGDVVDDMDQADIDALLNGDDHAGGDATSVDTADVEADGVEAVTDMDQSDIDALLNGDDRPAEAAEAAEAIDVDQVEPPVDMDQSDIDALLSGGADTDDATACDVTASEDSGAEAKLELADEVMDALAESDAAFDQLSEPEKQALYR